MWSLILVGLANAGPVPPVVSEPPTRNPGHVEPAPYTVKGKATLAVGQEIVVCARKAPMFRPGAYDCAQARVTVVDHARGPTVTEAMLWEAADEAGLDRTQAITVMSMPADAEPHHAMASGLGLSAPSGVEGLMGEYVFELSDGRKAVFLSQAIP